MPESCYCCYVTAEHAAANDVLPKNIRNIIRNPRKHSGVWTDPDR